MLNHATSFFIGVNTPTLDSSSFILYFTAMKAPSDKVAKHPEVVVGVVVRHKPSGKVLLTQGSKWTIWGSHGGHVKYGETIAQTAVRETREEVGLETSYVKIIQYGEMIEPKTLKKKRHFIFFHCLVDTDSDQVTIDNNEILDYKWIYPNEITKFKTNPELVETMKLI